MVIFLNGSFGVGKTTVSRLLVKKLARAAIYDPEYAGIALQRLPLWLSLTGNATGDFQDMPAWRRLTIAGVRATRLLYPVVVVPMTFTNKAYFEEIATGVGRFEPEIRHYPLMAPWAVVRERLFASGSDPQTRRGAWRFSHAAACCAQEFDADFGVPITTQGVSPDALAEDILGRMRPVKT